MHALSVSTHSAPRRRGLGGMARQVAVDLTPQAVEQVAARVAALLQRQQQNQEHGETSEPTGMLTVSQLAQHLHLHPAWVYEHADELGAIRIGQGPKARIRFDLYTAKEALRQNQPSRAPAPAPATAKPRPTPRRRRPSTSPPVELLPIHERRTLGAFARRRPPHWSGV